MESNCTQKIVKMSWTMDMNFSSFYEINSLYFFHCRYVSKIFNETFQISHKSESSSKVLSIPILMWPNIWFLKKLSKQNSIQMVPFTFQHFIFLNKLPLIEEQISLFVHWSTQRVTILILGINSTKSFVWITVVQSITRKVLFWVLSLHGYTTKSLL